MKVVVLGAGLMGKEAARDLVKSENVEKVFLADVQVEQVKAFKEKIQSDKIEAVRLDANDDAQLKDVMSKGDVVINALFYTFNEKVARTAVEVGVHSVDLGGHIGGATDAVLELADEAQAKGVTLIPDLGVAPGMINILSGYGASKLDEVKSIKLYVGGIPVDPEGPLKYNIVFSLDGVMDHYTDTSHVVRNGELLEVPSLSEIEPIHFDEFGELEAFHTSGGTSTLTKTFPNVETLEYKTIRYPGHAEKFKVLVDLGLTKKETTVEVGGKTVSTREVLKAALTPGLLLGDKQDAVLLRVIVSGNKDGQLATYSYELVTKKDMTDQVTAMARATANTISIVAQMIGNGEITKRGVYAPEQIVPGDTYISELKKRGVQIQESIQQSTSVGNV
ncbi:saccharopine dehydrogenase NADP-binding domain-containing protein [Paenisporosarcina quisquiliarum]|uniref:Saccharopine dehydrogenase NADP-binding domain-containing protein n=1 Tax=Paenisporosarcina quisquiliarum TaxID=365346 RepID=A0A9X3LI68_9BACL|nr:saccharopine dehydrogenase C-terminal domain-containing protein [Paenisporosarcina quisquiliarum]MCZ8538197.1 saccharopine dehydrogenase NADP-binding domain-containing protein [Paenisporosarcina quisquiliarum]